MGLGTQLSQEYLLCELRDLFWSQEMDRVMHVCNHTSRIVEVKNLGLVSPASPALLEALCQQTVSPPEWWPQDSLLASTHTYTCIWTHKEFSGECLHPPTPNLTHLTVSGSPGYTNKQSVHNVAPRNYQSTLRGNYLGIDFSQCLSQLFRLSTKYHSFGDAVWGWNLNRNSSSFQDLLQWIAFRPNNILVLRFLHFHSNGCSLLLLMKSTIKVVSRRDRRHRQYGQSVTTNKASWGPRCGSQ